MKQKMVVKVSMKDPKSRAKALKIVVSIFGVESASVKGDDKSQIEVIGDEVDAAQLTTLLRKGVGFTELVAVSVVDQKKAEEKKPEAAKLEVMPVWPHYYQMCEVSNPPIPISCYQQEPSCTIL